MKKNDGITLIALVISIIVLIILAGFAINTLMNNGIIDKAKTATQEYKNAQDYEETQIAKYTNDINSYIDGNRESKVKMEVIFNSIANTDNTEYDLISGKNIEDYDILEIYARTYDSGTKTDTDNCISANAVTRVYVKDIDYNKDRLWKYRVGTMLNPDYYFDISFSFRKNSALYFRDVGSKNWINSEIFLIIGYKY